MYSINFAKMLHLTHWMWYQNYIFFYKVVMGKMVLFQKFQQHKNKLKHLKILIILMFDPRIYWVDMSLFVWMVWSFMSINETFLCAIFIL